MVKNILLLSGEGQNSGKTTFAEMLCEKFKNEQITYIKISPHFHDLHENAVILYSSNSIVISRDFNNFSSKDTSRLLRAGCSAAYYIQASDSEIMKALSILNCYTDIKGSMIVESGALRKIYKPAVFIFVENQTSRKSKPELKEIADLNTSLEKIPFDINKIVFSNKQWSIR